MILPTNIMTERQRLLLQDDVKRIESFTIRYKRLYDYLIQFCGVSEVELNTVLEELKHLNEIYNNGDSLFGLQNLEDALDECELDFREDSPVCMTKKSLKSLQTLLKVLRTPVELPESKETVMITDIAMF